MYEYHSVHLALVVL